MKTTPFRNSSPHHIPAGNFAKRAQPDLLSGGSERKAGESATPTRLLPHQKAYSHPRRRQLWPQMTFSSVDFLVMHARQRRYNNITPSVVCAAHHPAPATRRIYTRAISSPQRHGLAPTHLPPRPRKTAWHNDITDAVWPRVQQCNTKHCLRRSQNIIHFYYKWPVRSRSYVPYYIYTT